MKFTEIPDFILHRVSVASNLRNYLTAISEVDQKLIDYAQTVPIVSMKSKMLMVRKLNSLAFQVVSGDYISLDTSHPGWYDKISLIDNNECKYKLKNLYLDISDIDWDLEYSVQPSYASTKQPDIQQSINLTVKDKDVSDSYLSKESDISFSFKSVPCFDTSKLWAIGRDIYNRPLPIYVTLPEIPKIQNDISLTTNIDQMSSQDLLALFPDHRLKPRHPELYQHIDGYAWDEILGYIPRISNFTEDQVRDNLIKYPKFSQLFRVVDDSRISFTQHLELSDGTLMPWQDAVSNCSDLASLPKSKVFYRDYIIRRYLLERDILQISHKYPLFGSFAPFMTLFTTPEEYRQLGYPDSEYLARCCVEGRVQFFQTRNPLVRGLLDER